jgi:dihydrofolate synthase/folylpolyglutamate synthase
VIDSAHNADSALKLRQTVDDYFPDRPVVLVFGASGDKDIAGMYAYLLPRVSCLIATASTHPRAADPETLLQLAEAYTLPKYACATIEEALEEAVRVAGSEALVLVTGSIFVAAGALQVWQTLTPRLVEHKG